MDHKQFFDQYGLFPVDSDYRVEDLYQAFKARLIEELRTQDMPTRFENVTMEGYRLVDTTEKP
jgi:hypothetical protein